MKKHLLVVVDEFFPIASAQAIRIHSFLKAFCTEYELTVLCGEEQESLQDKIPGVVYKTLERPKEGNTYAFLRYLVRFNSRILEEARTQNYDLVIVTIPRYEFLYAINKLKAMKVAYVLDIRDLLTAKNYELIFQRFLPSFVSSPFASLFEIIKQKNVRRAIDGSCFTSVAYPGLYDYYTTFLPEAVGKILFVPNGVDLAYFPVFPHRISKELRLFYVGNFHEKDMLQDVLAQISQFSEIEKLRLILVGTGREKESIERFVAQHGLSSITTFTGKIHHDRVSQFSPDVDVGIILRRKDLPTLLPVALVEYMAMGLPVLVNDYSELGTFVRETQSGFILSEVSALNPLLTELLKDKNTLDPIGKRNRKWIEEHGDRSKIAQDFKALVAERCF